MKDKSDLLKQLESIKKFDNGTYKRLSKEIEVAKEDEILELIRIEMEILEEHISNMYKNMFTH